MPKKKNFSEEQVKDVLNRYKEMESMRSIAKSYNVDVKVIKRLLRENSVEIRGVEYNGNAYKFDNTFFKDIDTESKAYWLGFVYADGYITKDKVLGVKLAKKDESHLYKFKKALKSEHPVYTYTSTGSDFSGKNYEYSLFQITNKNLVEDLKKLGVSSNKTYDCKFPNIPEELERHFIRGYFDGDGSVYESQGRPSMSILGTKNMVSEILTKICPESNSNVYFRKNSYYLHLAGKSRLIKIRDYLYKDSTVYLDRKKEKFFKLTR